jgi:hypothetical protein
MGPASADVLKWWVAVHTQAALALKESGGCNFKGDV